MPTPIQWSIFVTFLRAGGYIKRNKRPGFPDRLLSMKMVHPEGFEPPTS